MQASCSIYWSKEPEYNFLIREVNLVWCKTKNGFCEFLNQPSHSGSGRNSSVVIGKTYVETYMGKMHFKINFQNINFEKRTADLLAIFSHETGFYKDQN